MTCRIARSPPRSALHRRRLVRCWRVRSSDSFARWEAAPNNGGTMSEHPAEGELQALIDGELPRARVVSVHAHLLRCAICRARTEAARETATLVNALLRRSTPKVDSASAWERLVVRSGGRAVKARRG